MKFKEKLYMEYASSAQVGLAHERIRAVTWLRSQVRSLEEATKQARASACRGFQAMNARRESLEKRILVETKRAPRDLYGSGH